jgi:hypothetical protein
MLRKRASVHAKPSLAHFEGFETPQRALMPFNRVQLYNERRTEHDRLYLLQVGTPCQHEQA